MRHYLCADWRRMNLRWHVLWLCSIIIIIIIKVVFLIIIIIIDS